MKRYISIIVLFTLIVNILNGQSKEFKKVLNYYHFNNNFNGSVIVATNGKVDYTGSIGIANRQTATNITSKSKFKIASITKTFTAVLILQLYEQGKLELNVPFGKYFPSYQGEAKDKVTIEHLLTYSSRIPNKAEALQPYQLPKSLDQFIDQYCSGNLEGLPGGESNYGNTEYIILHKIIENITGKSFDQVLKENILLPLEMGDTNMHKSTDIIQGLVSSYTINDSTKIIAADEPYYIENYFGAGAIYSTVMDLLKFDQGIFQNKLLSKTTT
ncbi:MAG: hypothetical protein RLZZ546_2315, partial [Bacteroidota bacterium]